MPRLYLEEYRRALIGQTIIIACRESILRDHFPAILADVKFLNRQDLTVHLLHNLPKRLALHTYFEAMATRLRQTQVVRIPPEQDFYDTVLNYQQYADKIVFLERKALMDHHGQRINALSTERVRQSFASFRDLIANPNLQGIIEQICYRLEIRQIARVHILPAGRYAIKHELFTVEGSGTLIANDFVETFDTLKNDDEIHIVCDILKQYRRDKFLKVRTLDYIYRHRDDFFVVKIDGIIVGCTEKIVINANTVELGGLAISTKFRNQQIGLMLVHSFLAEMRRQGFGVIISLTNNPKLISLYRHLGFQPCSAPEYQTRQARSPGVKMFWIDAGSDRSDVSSFQ